MTANIGKCRNLLGPRCTKPKQFSAAAFSAAWQNRDLSADDVARAFGMSRATANRSAKALQLPAKPRGRRPKFCFERFATLWSAGVKIVEMAQLLKVDDMTITNTVNRLGLPLRGRGRRPATTLDQYRETLMSRAMAHTAAQEQAAIINAEMADGCGSAGQLVGAKHARAA